MRTTKYVLFAALGIAAVLFLTSDAAKDMRDSVEDQTKKLKNKLKKIGGGTADTISELRDVLSNEIEGLSDDARERIENILDGAAKSTGKLKRNVSRQLS